MASDYSRKVSEALIAQLQRGTAPWQRPWKPGERSLPYNPTTDNDYRGINSIWLAAQGYGDARWLTYKQAAAAGAQVRRGEKGTVVEYWKFYGDEPVRDAAGNVVTENGKIKTQRVEYDKPKVFHAVVFNAEQIDGMPAATPRQLLPEHKRHELAEAILRDSGARISYGGNIAAYSPARDTISIPHIVQFTSADAYYATALHELGHWTGHHTRLNRDLSHPFGSEGYAREELRAEIASLMIGDRIGVGHDPERHAAYVGSWIKALQEDPREIFRAAADAEKIQRHVLELHQEKVQFLEQQSGRTLIQLQELAQEATQAARDAEQAIAEARQNPLFGESEIAEATAIATAWRDESYALLMEAVNASAPSVRDQYHMIVAAQEAVASARTSAENAAMEAVLASASPEIQLGSERAGDATYFIAERYGSRTVREFSSLSEAMNAYVFGGDLANGLSMEQGGLTTQLITARWDGDDGLYLLSFANDEVQDLYAAAGRGELQPAPNRAEQLAGAAAEYHAREAVLYELLEQHGLARPKKELTPPSTATLIALAANDADRVNGPLQAWNNLQRAAERQGLDASVRLALGNERVSPAELSGTYIVEYAKDGVLLPIQTHIWADGKALTFVGPNRVLGTGWTSELEWQANALESAVVSEARERPLRDYANSYLDALEPVLTSRDVSYEDRAMAMQQRAFRLAESYPAQARDVGDYMILNAIELASGRNLDAEAVTWLGISHNSYSGAVSNAGWASLGSEQKLEAIRDAVMGRTTGLVAADQPKHLAQLFDKQSKIEAKLGLPSDPQDYLHQQAELERARAAAITAEHGDPLQAREAEFKALYADALRNQLGGRSFQAQLADLAMERGASELAPDQAAVLQLREEVLRYAVRREDMDALSIDQLEDIRLQATDELVNLENASEATVARAPAAIEVAAHERTVAAAHLAIHQNLAGALPGDVGGRPLDTLDYFSESAMANVVAMERMRQHAAPGAHDIGEDVKLARRYRLLPSTFQEGTHFATGNHVDADVASYKNGSTASALPYLASGIRIEPAGTEGTYGEYLKNASQQIYDDAAAYNQELRDRDPRGYEALCAIEMAWATAFQFRDPLAQPLPQEMARLYSAHAKQLESITDELVREEAERVMDASAASSHHYASLLHDDRYVAALKDQATALEESQLRGLIDKTQQQVAQAFGGDQREHQQAAKILAAYEDVYLTRLSPQQQVTSVKQLDVLYTFMDYDAQKNVEHDNLPEAMRAYVSMGHEGTGNLYAQVDGQRAVTVVMGSYGAYDQYEEICVTDEVEAYLQKLLLESARQDAPRSTLAPGTAEEAAAVKSVNALIVYRVNAGGLRSTGTEQAVQVGNIDELARANTAPRELERMVLVRDLQSLAADSAAAGQVSHQWANDALVAMQRDDTERAIWALDKFAGSLTQGASRNAVGVELADLLKEGVMNYRNTHQHRAADPVSTEASVPVVAQAAATEQRVYLAVPFIEKDLAKNEAKAAGFKLEWDKETRAWWAPADADLSGLAQWRIGASSTRSVKNDGDIADEFGNAIRSAGYYLDGPAIMDGKIHRVRVDGDRGAERSGAYCGYLEGDRSAGYWENHRTKDRQTWKVEGPVEAVDPAQRAALNAQAAQRREQQERERAERHVAAAGQVAVLLGNAPAATPENTYCAKKGITTPAGLYTVPAAGSIEGVLIGNTVAEAKELRTANPGQAVFMKNDLLLPLRDFDGNTWSVQSINPSFKALMTGGKKTGMHCLAGTDATFAESSLAKNPALPLILAEGYATADSVSRLAGQPVIAAIDSGNLIHVATELRQRYPDREIWIAGDNDHAKEGKINAATGKPEINVGMVSAKEAAKAVGGIAVLPTFVAGDRGSDWNDVYMKPGASKEEASAKWEAAVAVAQFTRHAQKAALTQSQAPQQSEQQKQARVLEEQLVKKRGISR